MLTRRDFVRRTLGSSTLLSLGATVPSFVSRSAAAAAALGKRAADRILVVIQLSGGNDGLNTVVPYKDELYAKHRRALRLDKSQVLKIDDGIALHPSLKALAGLLHDGLLSIVQGVGYPNPDRSHFRSMEIWQTARLEEGRLDSGWLGRALDAQPQKPGSLPAINVDAGKPPLTLLAQRTQAPTLTSLEEYRLNLGGQRKLLDQLAEVRRGGASDMLDFMQRSTLAAYTSSDRLQEASGRYQPKVTYPEFGLAQRLKLMAQVINANLGTRIFYTSLGGFDTHARQLQAHAELLRELSESVSAFVRDLAKQGQAERVAVLTFSEFGRRVEENGSAGTDHGTAAPMLLMGGGLKPGPHGAHPRLDRLVDGDLAYHTDFRRVYATLLDGWLGVPSELVLGGKFEKLGFLKA